MLNYQTKEIDCRQKEEGGGNTFDVVVKNKTS